MNSRQANSPRPAGHDAGHQKGAPSPDLTSPNSRERGGGLSEAAAAPSFRTRFPAHHVVRMTLEHCDGVDGGVTVSVATCACGWTHHAKQADYEIQDAAVEAHWQAIEAAGQETAWHNLAGHPIDTRATSES